MHTDSGRFRLAALTVRTCVDLKQRLACSEVDAIAKRRSQRDVDAHASVSTHVSLHEAIARQRQRDALKA